MVILVGETAVEVDEDPGILDGHVGHRKMILGMHQQNVHRELLPASMRCERLGLDAVTVLEIRFRTLEEFIRPDELAALGCADRLHGKAPCLAGQGDDSEGDG